MINRIKSYIEAKTIASSIKENKIILYGCGKVGKDAFTTLKSLNLEVYKFCDSNKEKEGQLFLNKEIIWVENLKNIDNYVLIISSSFEDEIISNLEKIDINNYVTGIDFYTVIYPLLKL